MGPISQTANQNAVNRYDDLEEFLCRGAWTGCTELKQAEWTRAKLVLSRLDREALRADSPGSVDCCHSGVDSANQSPCQVSKVQLGIVKASMARALHDEWIEFVKSRIPTEPLMKKNEPIAKIMTTDLTTVHDGQPVSSLRGIFEEGKIHHIPVVSGDNLIGIVTSNDFMRISFGEFGNQDGKGLDNILDHTYKMHDVMHRDPVTIGRDGTIRDAARLLGSHSFHALPVVEGEKLVGLITSTDLIQYLAEL